MADYPDLLLSYRVVFQLVSAILADDVGQFLLAVVQSWRYGMASTLFFFLPLYFAFLMSFQFQNFVFTQSTHECRAIMLPLLWCMKFTLSY